LPKFFGLSPGGVMTYPSISGGEMLQPTLTIVGATLFGTNVTSETKIVRDAAEELTAVFPQHLAIWSKLANLIRPSRKRRFLSIGQRLDASIARIIATTRQMGSGDSDDLLAMLLNAQDEDGYRMPAQQVRDEAITILLAGHETTAIAMTWALRESFILTSAAAPLAVTPARNPTSVAAQSGSTRAARTRRDPMRFQSLSLVIQRISGGP
jgi:hypothetical protein